MKTKSALIAEISSLVGAVGDKFDTDEVDAERDYLAAHCPPRLERTVRELPTLGLHLLAELADGPISVVGLAARAGQLKGTVSKHVQKLVDAGLVTRSPVPGNRKELQLTPTADGKRLIEVHQRMHDEMDAGRHDFLSRYTVAELSVLEKMLQDLLATSRDGVRLVPAGLGSPPAPERGAPSAREQT
ncbi:transcriptional regulator [Mycolicibacterium mucogenicum]|uniref:Transcriptional regulator n=1 Tax=Mycolicibacterium mucogenicum TaxID=56689 RepID=A0A1A3GNT8_MYCMU|nr:MarR family transcriptional regulator [Mycolicibacterium mucogenicum]OBJ37061.1 transcriptional regulator [Mycolicibacterium mucogenicum]